MFKWLFNFFKSLPVNGQEGFARGAANAKKKASESDDRELLEAYLRSTWWPQDDYDKGWIDELLAELVRRGVDPSEYGG